MGKKKQYRAMIKEVKEELEEIRLRVGELVRLVDGVIKTLNNNGTISVSAEED